MISFMILKDETQSRLPALNPNISDSAPGSLSALFAYFVGRSLKYFVLLH